MIDQRRPNPRRKRHRRPGVLWNPELPRLRPKPADVYLVVDELEEGTAIVLANRWPELDGLGRLRFREDVPLAAVVSRRSLETALRRARPGSGSRRPLRIGDVFLVRGLPTGTDRELAVSLLGQPPRAWGTLHDITGAARDAAKAALFGAAAPRVSEQQADALQITKPTPPKEPPPAGTVARPVL